MSGNLCAARPTAYSAHKQHQPNLVERGERVAGRAALGRSNQVSCLIRRGLVDWCMGSSVLPSPEEACAAVPHSRQTERYLSHYILVSESQHVVMNLNGLFVADAIAKTMALMHKNMFSRN